MSESSADFKPEDAAESAADGASATKPNGAGHNSRRYRLYTLDDIEALPQPTWIVDGVIPANSLGFIYGKPGVGKSFIVLAMALCLVYGQNWCGKRTTPGAVMYVCAEGLFGLRSRVQAYRKKYGGWIAPLPTIGTRAIMPSSEIDERETPTAAAATCSSATPPQLH